MLIVLLEESLINLAGFLELGDLHLKGVQLLLELLIPLFGLDELLFIHGFAYL